MFDWLFGKRDLKKNPPKNKSIWHYTCENGHEWQSKDSPGGGVFASKTICPECGTEICMSDEYINGEYMGGAIHAGFGLKGKKKEKKLKELDKEAFLAKIKYGV